MSIRLHNQGKRTIQFGLTENESVEPNKVVIVSNEIGARLKQLYKGELVDLDKIEVSYDADAVKDFSGKADDEAKEQPLTPAEKRAAKKKADDEAKAALAAEAAADDDSDQDAA